MAHDKLINKGIFQVKLPKNVNVVATDHRLWIAEEDEAYTLLPLDPGEEVVVRFIGRPKEDADYAQET